MQKFIFLTGCLILVAPELKATSQEVRIGLLRHDIKSRLKHHYEKGYDANFEYLFQSFKMHWWQNIWAPRLHVGTHLNTKKGSHQFYTGLTWRYDFNRWLFSEVNFGGEAHTGKIKHRSRHKAALGLRVMFREGIALGIQFNHSHSVSVLVDHTSNASLASPNPGITNLGLRYGYRF